MRVKAGACATLVAMHQEVDRMVWRRLFEPEQDPENPDETPAASEATGAPKRAVPPHLAERLNLQARRTGTSVDLHRRLTRLRNQQEQTRYDIAQGELALEDDNPWKQRVALLTETLETVEMDRELAEQVIPGPYAPVPPTPITDLDVAVENDVSTVRYTVGDERFVFEEPLDWAERGHQIARTELARTAGETDAVMNFSVPGELRDELLRHLDHSLFVFATVLRDRQLDGEPMPADATLADLAKPCPVCGGWMDYRDRCQYCARRKLRLQELFQERGQLLNERAAEIEEQHRVAERLPLARRRLADIEAEIAKLEQKIAESE
jgi:hypothetical protein